MNRLLILGTLLVSGLFNAASPAMDNKPPYSAWLEALQKNPKDVSITHVPKYYLSITMDNKKNSRALDEKEVKLFIAELEKKDTDNAKKIAVYLQQLVTIK